MIFEDRIKENKWREKRKQLLIDSIQDILNEWILHKEIAYQLWIPTPTLSRIKTWHNIYLSSKKVEEYLKKLNVK